MAETRHIIEPERMGLWVAVTLIIALLALGSSIAALKRVYETTIISQAEILLLNDKIDAAQNGSRPVAPSTSAQNESSK